MRAWNGDLEVNVTNEEWSEALNNIYKTFFSESLWITQLFFLYRAYYTPSNLYKWGNRETGMCPRCRIEEGDFYHMVWRCPKLLRYWTQIRFLGKWKK